MYIDIMDMECRLFRMAQKEWKLNPSECAKIFSRYKVFDFIEDCYDSLHLSSYKCALDDIHTLLAKQIGRSVLFPDQVRDLCAGVCWE